MIDFVGNKGISILFFVRKYLFFI